MSTEAYVDALRRALVRRSEEEPVDEKNLAAFHPEIPLTTDSKSYKEHLYHLEKLHSETDARPYCPILRLRLARLYDLLEYSDLATGEAYNALLLVDEISDSYGEWHDDAVSEVRRTLQEQGGLSVDREVSGSDENEEEGEEELVQLAEGKISLLAYTALTLSLLKTGCLKTAADFLRRAIRAHGDTSTLLAIRSGLPQKLREHFPNETFEEGDVLKNIDEYPDRALVRREIYPWNPFEPSRYSAESLDLLNRYMQDVAPKLEVRVTELPLLHSESSVPDKVEPTVETVKQLGVFAKEDLRSGEVVLRETSLLTAHARLHDSFCDACSGELPPPPPPATIPLDLDDEVPKGPETSPSPETAPISDQEGNSISCPHCATAVFCSEYCLNAAQASYHPSECSGQRRSASSNSSNTSDDENSDEGFEIGGESTHLGRNVPPSEAADALYALVLLRALSMAKHLKTHVLQLREVQFLWGDFTPSVPIIGRGDVSELFTHILPSTPSSSPDPSTSLKLNLTPLPIPKTLPYTPTTSLLLPQHHLTSTLLTSPFSPTHGLGLAWVWQTLLAKLRGVASARQGLDGRPSVAAVHPLWCLANHSCDPNVGWGWGEDGTGDQSRGALSNTDEGPQAQEEGGRGAIRFWVRRERVPWAGREEMGRREGGIRKGEEVLGHYCDVELGVNDRREWAAGALGGICMCERCVWEAGVEERRRGGE